MEHRMSNIEEKINRMQSEIDALRDDLHQVEKDQAETRVYVKQIFDTLDELKLHVRSQLTKDDLLDLFKSNNQSNQDNLEAWQKWTLAVLGGTLFVVIGYFFGK